MESGAGRADGCAPVAAAYEEPFVGFAAGVVVLEDLAGSRVMRGGRAGEVDRASTASRGDDLVEPTGELRILGDADCVAVCFGELTQARRAVEGCAPVSRGELGCDGGGLPGWAAEAARVMVGGALSVMGSLLRWSGVVVRVSQRMVPVPRQTRQRRRRPVQVVRAPSPLQLGHLTRFMGMAYVLPA
ncbi:hypothetical protein GCM10011579_084690 [Streptomyces albiflavescens]|uniref:Uncharacterized protein n=1 Tax=Streptomyces albiflavescens TaxID=1623582 RepID=A0A917YF63_9ACTN|nr:hypothetical protein GCM10011579_084690 [Streptomyces albiflavescens]